jgi:hypothetical protein
MIGWVHTDSLCPFLAQRLELHLVGDVAKKVGLFGDSPDEGRLKLGPLLHDLLDFFLRHVD